MRTWWRLATLIALGLVVSSCAVAAKGVGPAVGVVFVVGNDAWQPGTHYRSGDDWLALACSRDLCSFEPARLSVRQERWQGHYDEQATSGQRLTFSKQAPSRATVVAWFQRQARDPWLTPGPVTTFAAPTRPRKQPNSIGTLETAVDLPEGRHAVLIPLLDRERSVLMLQLRADGKRQLLGQLGACSGTVVPTYLLWAGDLDGDGRPDYLVSFIDADGQVLLYRGQDASAPDIVSIAGTYDAPPSGGECDSAGWLER